MVSGQMPPGKLPPRKIAPQQRYLSVKHTGQLVTGGKTVRVVHMQNNFS